MADVGKPQRKISLDDNNPPIKVAGIEIRMAKAGEFRPQRTNANAHTPRGMGMLGDAINADGYVAPMTAAANGEIIDGSARIEIAPERLGEDVIVIEHDGRRPIVAVRTDIQDAESDTAKRIAIAANRIAEVNLNWDISILRELNESNLLDKLWNDEEMKTLLGQFAGVAETDQPRLDEKRKVQCPQCGAEFEPR